MKAAFVTVGDASRLTGGYLYHARVFERLGEFGFEIEEVVPCGASPEEQKSAGVAALSAFDPRRYDVVVVDMLARIAAAPHVEGWRRERPVVAMIHELPSVAAPEGKFRAGEVAAENTLLGAVDLCVAVSEHGKSVLEGRGVLSERVRVVSPGFDGLRRGPSGEGVRSSGSEVRALCVAQWIPRKGILELVEAWRAANVPNATLELVGETEADPEYASKVKAAAGANVAVRGALDDETLASAYAQADVFVLPSRYEGYGIVFAEALSFGLPVVACDVGPVPELVGEEAAIFVSPGDVGEISRAIRTVLRDGELRSRMSHAALRRAESLPRWNDAARGFAGVLREAAESFDALAAQNRRSWNEAVRAHERHRKHLSAFISDGGSTLFPEETKLLGDVSGKSVAHLMCGAGGDSVSLASPGASVTGVDVSDEAVGAARRLSKASGVPARFERADVYEWLENSAADGRSFDLVFSSYGVICWLSDLERWARGISGVLESGGRFVLVEFHPFAATLDEGWKVARDYLSGGAERDERGVGDYVGDSGGGLTPSESGGTSAGDFENPEACHLFRWGLGDIVSAIVGAGMEIEVLEEYPYSNGERNFSGMREGENRRMYPPGSVPKVPLMYGLSARKGVRAAHNPRSHPIR